MKTRSRSVMPRLARASMTLGMRAQHPVALDVLVYHEVGLNTRHLLERLHAIRAQRHHALVGGVRRPIQADHRRPAGGRGPTLIERTHLGLARLGELDRGEAPTQSHRGGACRYHSVLTAQHRSGGARIRLQTTDPGDEPRENAITSAAAAQHVDEMTPVATKPPPDAPHRARRLRPLAWPVCGCRCSSSCP